MQDAPGSVPLTVTLTTADCTPDQLRERMNLIRKGWFKLFRRDGRKLPLLARKCLKAFGHLEAVPSARDPSKTNAHLHAVVLMAPTYPYTGRNHFRTADSDQWCDWWDAAVSGQARSAHVEPVDNLEAVLKYSYKTSSKIFGPDGRIYQPAYVNPTTLTIRPAAEILSEETALAGLTRSVTFDGTHQ